MGPLDIVGRCISLVGVAVLLVGIYDITENNVKNSCEMTYMYEMPSYEPVLKSNSHGRRYTLYLYSEASKRKNVRSRIPVLFIPGNAGSYKQVRSLASVSLRMAIDKKHTFEYDFYSIDFNEEFSALYGGFLNDQTNFLMECLEWIDGFVSEPYPGVILVGHSIGGLIGRNVLAHPNYNLLRNPVASLITLATPHQPILLTDVEMDLFYRRLPYVNPRVSYINIGGGERDIQVRSGLALFNDADVNVILNSSPGIWVSADHRCIVWCKQLIIAMNRALSEIVSQNGVLKDKDVISSSFAYHLQKRHHFFKSSKVAAEYKSRSISYDSLSHSHSWISQNKYAFAYRGKMNATTFFLLPISSSKETLFVESFNLRGNWIFACKGQSEDDDVCLHPKNMFEWISVLPGKRRTAVHLPMSTHEGYSHYALVVVKGSENPKFNVDIYDPSSRTLVVETSSIQDYLGLPLLNPPLTTSSFYNITFPDLTSFWRAYEVSITPQKDCSTESEETLGGSLHFVSSHSNEVTHAQVSSVNVSRLITKLLSVSTTPPSDKLSHVLVYLSSKCSFKIEARVSWMHSFGQIARYYFPTIVPLFMSVLLFAIGGQYIVYEDEKYFPSLWNLKVLSPIYVLVYLAISSVLLVAFMRLHEMSLSSQTIEEPLLTAFLLCLSMGWVSVLSLFAWVLVVIGGNALSKFISGLSSLPEVSTDYLLEHLWRWAPLLCPVLISLAFASCGSFVLCVGLLLHVLKLFKMYESYLQDLAKDSDSAGPHILSEFYLRSNSLNYYFSVTMLWFLSSLLNAPILLTWIRNDFVSLPYDPSLFTALVLIFTSIRSLSDSPIDPNLKGYKIMGYLLHGLGFINVIFCVLRVYRINYTLNLALATMSLHQIWAPKLCP